MAALKRKIPLGSPEGRFMEDVIHGENKEGIIRDYRGHETLAVGKYFLPELGWAMIVKIDTKELFAPIEKMKWIAILVALFTIVAVFFAAYKIAQVIAQPVIYLMQKANLIAAGNLSESIDIPSKNEVGRLAFSFNKMTKKLKNIIEHLDELVKERTTELTNTQDRLLIQEKLASLGALTAGIAHEIKNPLNFVNNFSALSLDLIDSLVSKIGGHSPLDTEETEEFSTLRQNIKSVIDQGKKADSIVQRMLAHSRAGLGVTSMTDLNQLISEYLELTFHGVPVVASEINIKIRRNFDKSIEKINVIAEDIGRVFLNIFNNAFYAMYKKSEFDPTYSPILEVTTHNNEAEIEIRIRDNGIGMSQEVAKQVFTPFFTTKPPGEGTGLGLSLSYNIIAQEHGGTFEFKTEEGEYTEFVITLPKVTPL